MAEHGTAQSAHLEKADRFLQASNRALRAADYETAVSRAYYTVFHAIRALVSGLENVKSHRQVIDRCVQWNNRYTRLNGVANLFRYKSLQASLEGLYAWRLVADYDIEGVDTERAQEAVVYAHRFLARIKEVQR